MMLAVFWCRQRNIFCFVGIYILFPIKKHSTGYSDQRGVVCIIYQAQNSGAIMWSADRSEKDLNTVVNYPASGKVSQSTTVSS